METTTPKPFVFVLMPFDREFDDVYQLGIKPACDIAGAYAERVDEQVFAESILDRIYNQISKADVIVSDMTGRNPNVFYETGYAHALGKKVILLTRRAEDIPFDLKHYSHIVYGDRIIDLIGDLETRVRWALQQPEAAISHHGIQFFIDGQRLPNQQEITRTTTPLSKPPGTYFDLKIDVHNSVEKLVRAAKFKIGLFVETAWREVVIQYGKKDYFGKHFQLPDGTRLSLFDPLFELLPGAWESIWLHFKTYDRYREPLIEADSFAASLRIFSEEGVVDVPFRLLLLRDKIVRST